MKTVAGDTYKTGLMAEAWAVLILRLKGYRILAQRYKTSSGEIDIVACKGRLLVFAEVKARATIAEALSCLTPAMQKRIVNAARHFIAVYPAYVDYEMRFDLLAVDRSFRFRHLDNAWSAHT